MPVTTSLSVGEVAQATGLSVRVLRHWEAVGLVQPHRSGSGHRRYGDGDLVRVVRALALRRAGLGLAARTALRDRLAKALRNRAPDTDPADALSALMEVISQMVLLDDYVHGYQPGEGMRLRDQARTLADLLHHDTVLPAGSSVLELGCGVGAQTVELLRRSPGLSITGVDRSATSLAAARARLREVGAVGPEVVLLQADLFDLPHDEGPLAAGTFDHVVLCFVLEHLDRPEDALDRARRMLRPGGTVTVVEGDHGSTAFHPDTAAARASVACQVSLQRSTGGDPDIGRRLYPLLRAAGYEDVSVSPRQIYVDGSRPQLAEGFIRETFTAMVQGVRTPAIAAGLTTAELFDEGVRDLLRTAEPDGTFSYTFYKAQARAPRVRDPGSEGRD